MYFMGLSSMLTLVEYQNSDIIEVMVPLRLNKVISLDTPEGKLLNMVGASNKGILISLTGSSWVYSNITCGEFLGLCYNSDLDVCVAVSKDSGFFISTSGGSNWDRVGDYKRGYTNIDYSVDTKFYLATNLCGEILYSRDLINWSLNS